METEPNEELLINFVLTNGTGMDIWMDFGDGTESVVAKKLDHIGK